MKPSVRHAAAAACAALAVAALDGAPQQALAADARSSPAQTVAGRASAVGTPGEHAGNGCAALPDAKTLARLVADAPTRGEMGGFAGAKNEWAAIVDRQGRICAVAVAARDPAAAWPGSKAIAKAKAFTANAFSSDTKPMSTARLYTMSLPGHSLWSAANGNPFNPECLTAPSQKDRVGIVCGGTIAFGGGLPLYKGKTRVGGLGLSGDTPCADHEAAKRVRDAAGLNPPTGEYADDIVYASVDGPSVFAHPLCPNTWRNGRKIGDEPPAHADMAAHAAAAAPAASSASQPG